jgi:glycosyltransferase involved in cell wall biosynthesis
MESGRSYEVISSGGVFSQYLRAPIKYLRGFRDVDLVVEVCNGMPFLSPLWRRGPILCLVNHVHTDQWSAFFNPVVAAFGRNVEAKVMPFVHRNNLVVTISPSTRSSLRKLGISDERIREIPQGVAEPPTLHDKSATPLFVAVGRLVSYKRIDLLIEMWRSVHRVTGGSLVVIGEGPARPKLEALGIPGVTFTGFVPESEKHRLMCEAWALLHAASWEGWGLVITEAAVRGTPAVGFDVPGVRDAIVEGQTGLLATTKDDFQRHWIRLTEDAALREELGAGGMKRSLSASWAATAEAFEQVAAETVKRHRSSRRSMRHQQSETDGQSDASITLTPTS